MALSNKKVFYKIQLQMNYYIVSFPITINGDYRDHGTIGCMSPFHEYQHHDVKQTIFNHFKNVFPAAKSVTVTILKEEVVSKNEYDLLSKKFLVVGD